MSHFGSQGWWPTTKNGAVAPSYALTPRVKSLTSLEQFEICVGAILTQNTAWSNVEKALIELHKRGIKTPQSIIEISSSSLEKLIRPSGYFRQKAKKLKLFSRYVVDHYQGNVSKLLKQPGAKVREELLELYGIGPETADSILLYAATHAIFVVDAYTKRIGQRLGLFNTEKYEEVQNYFHTRLQKSAPLYNEYHALLVALGKDFCRPTPRCPGCPLKNVCKFNHS